MDDMGQLHLVFRSQVPIETRDLDEDIIIDLNEKGRVCSMTLEHAQEKVGDSEVDYTRISAEQASGAEPPPAS